MKRLWSFAVAGAMAIGMGCDQLQNPTMPENGFGPAAARNLAANKNDAAEKANLEAIKARIAHYRAAHETARLAKSRPQQTEATLTVPGQYPTIQDAVNAAAAGDVINVSSQATPYVEQVVVTVANLKILGQGSARVPVTGGFVVDASGVEIANFNITGNGGDGIAVMAVSAANIHHNTIAGAINGISLNGSTDCEVVANTCNGNGDGIDVNAGATLNHVEVNFCKQNSDDGIDLDGANDNHLHDNICSLNISDGIEITDCNDNMLAEQYCNNNGGSGIAVGGLSSGNKFDPDNVVKKNDNYGMRFESGTSGNKVKNSEIRKNQPCDIDDAGTDNRFKKNTIDCSSATIAADNASAGE